MVLAVMPITPMTITIRTTTSMPPCVPKHSEDRLTLYNMNDVVDMMMMMMRWAVMKED